MVAAASVAAGVVVVVATFQVRYHGTHRREHGHQAGSNKEPCFFQNPFGTGSRP